MQNEYFKQIAAELKEKREAKRKRLQGFLNAIPVIQRKQPDIKVMRDFLVNLHNALPLVEGQVQDTYDKQPRVFFGSQQEFISYTQDRPSYWADDRVKKVYTLLLSVDYDKKDKNTLLRLKNIFTLIK